MIEIKRIEPTRSALRRFVKFQVDLYRDNEYFVPPLITDDMNTLDPRKNPAFDFCESAYFMAYDGGKPVGRVAGIINRQVNGRSGKKEVRFGFIDFVDDREVSAALLAAVEQWGRDKGMTSIVGPLGFSDLDHEGTLIEGFEELSTMSTIYNYPYYAEHIEALGYAKDSDWKEFVMDVPDGIPEKFNRIAEIVKKKFGLRVKKYTSRSKIKEEIGRPLFQLINEAYDGLYQYSPLTDRQIVPKAILVVARSQSVDGCRRQRGQSGGWRHLDAVDEPRPAALSRQAAAHGVVSPAQGAARTQRPR